jgi:hypothetical protein
MPPMDQTGRNIHVGQLVHVPMNGMFAAEIVNIIDSKMIIPGQQNVPPQVVLQVIISMPIVQNHCGVYVVGNMDKHIQDTGANSEGDDNGDAENQKDKLIQFPTPS